MLKVLWTRFKQGHQTIKFPDKEPKICARFRGRTVINRKLCDNCFECVSGCPTAAISDKNGKVEIDLGRCIFCGTCTTACTKAAIVHSQEYRMATGKRWDLIVSDEEYKCADALGKELRRILGRSLKLRQVSAGGCNACEADTNVLSTIGFDLSRFGIQFVASPRHADGILVTGPVTKNMELALRKTYDAIPAPKIVIATGACAISGGLFRDHEETCAGVDHIFSVDLYIPGCPPHPITILDGLLRIIGKR